MAKKFVDFLRDAEDRLVLTCRDLESHRNFGSRDHNISEEALDAMQAALKKASAIVTFLTAAEEAEQQADWALDQMQKHERDAEAAQVVCTARRLNAAAARAGLSKLLGWETP